MGIIKDIRIGVKKHGMNYFIPTWLSYRKGDAHNGNRYFAPVQFERVKVDVSTWRDAVKEAELAFYPHRVKMQRIFQDTVLNGQVTAAMKKYKDLVLLKDFRICSGETIDKKSTDLLQHEWFYTLSGYILDAPWFGYTLAGLGDLVEDKFPNIQLIKRWNVNPGTYDRLPYMSSYVYSLSGINFTDPSIKDESGNSYYDWMIWVPTPTETGATPCGYGLLYKIAYYEILIRNNVGFNATANERFGMPIIVAKTTKTDEEGDKFTGERSNFESMVNNIGAAGGIVTDPTDEVELIETTKGGKGSNTYESFEERMLKMINKIVFGHADAMDSQQGKLGGEDAAKESVEAVEKAVCRWYCHVINSEVIPKLQKIGFPIPMGYTFELLNSKEEVEKRVAEDENNKKTAEVVQTFKNAGYQVDEKYITERTGIPLKKVEESKEDPDANKRVKEKLKNLYERV